MTQASVKVGMIAEETGGLSFMGRANANVARMVVDEINADGGLLGRKIELYLEDGATTDAVAEARAAKRPADLLHRPGAGAAARPAHSLADAQDPGQDILPAVRRLHLAARDERKGPPARHRQWWQHRRRGILSARSHGVRRDSWEDHVQRRGGGVQHHRSAWGRAVLRATP